MLDHKTPECYMKYNEFVRKLAKPGSQILAELEPEDCHRLHMAVGISGEAGELLDAIKKAVIYRKPLDIANVREECGDLLFYIAGMLDSIGATLDDVAAENVAKLSIRYGKSYSNQAAIKRADKDHGAEVKSLEPDDDFNEIVPRACSMDEDCESCQ